MARVFGGYGKSMIGDPADDRHILSAVPARVTVVGDVILDRWVRGAVQRVSREAPVPVVDVEHAEECAGGAANTAMNLAALGARVRLVSVLSDDPHGRSLLRLLQDAGVDTSAVLVRAGGTTASKTRVMGENQILVRVDHAAAPGMSPDERAHVAAGAALAGADAGDALIVCDYDAGLFDDDSAARLGELFAAASRPARLVVDAHDLVRWAPLRPDVVTPNARETAALLGVPSLGQDRHAAAAGAATRILAAAAARSAVVTLDVDGTVCLEDGRVTGRTSAVPAIEQQASGAGDTFVAALAVALCAGTDLPRAARFAQRAADVVVGRAGTAVCTASDLSGARPPGPLAPDELQNRVARERARGRRVVFTNGCFDLIHRGHTTHLQQAKALGDILIVALNDDDSIRRLKGTGRPVTPLAERIAVIEALGCVDYVTSFTDDSPIELLRLLQPEIYAKGGDYTPEMLPETATIREYGGEVRILDYLPAHSTTEIVDRIGRARALGTAAG